MLLVLHQPDGHRLHLRDDDVEVQLGLLHGEASMDRCGWGTDSSSDTSSIVGSSSLTSGELTAKPASIRRA